MGMPCSWVALDLAMQSTLDDLGNPSWWMLIGIGLLLVPYVVNIGFGVATGAWPRTLSVIMLLAGIAISLFWTGNLLDFPFWVSATPWMIYVFAHLGISFLLSALLATPGCEMRAIPHLLGMLRGKDATEHYCPGFIDNIDRWEQQQTSHGDKFIKLQADDPRSRDLLDSAGPLLLFYGLPFAILQLAGNLGSFTIATRIPALAFFAVALVCCINILRSRRVHCYLIAPRFLVISIGLALYSFDVFSFGANTWSFIVNGGLIAGVCLSFHMESIWGSYFKKN